MATNPELDNITEHVGKQTTPQDPTVKIDLTINEFNAVMAAIQELPHRVADPILKKMFSQAQIQLQPTN